MLKEKKQQYQFKLISIEVIQHSFYIIWLILLYLFSMNINVDFLRMSSPLSNQSNRSTNNQLNLDYLQFRLNSILMTLQTQKEEFQDKMTKQKQILQTRIQEKENQIKMIQQRNTKLSQQCRQLKFNYHQRGSIIDYIKNKIKIIQQKFEVQKQQMVSLIKYLQSQNEYLNQKNLINTKNYQQKIIQLTPNPNPSRHSLFSKKNNYNQELNPKLNRITEKRCIIKNVPYLFPNQMMQGQKTLYIDQNNPFQLKQFSWEDGYQKQEIFQEQYLDKTIKNEQKLNRIKSHKSFNKNQKIQCFQHIKNKSSFQFKQQGSMKPNYPIFINNYGNMRINELGFGSTRRQQERNHYQNRKPPNKTPNQIYSELRSKIKNQIN